VPDPAVRLTPRELAGVRLACLGRLTAGILHEFRNPLAIVQGNPFCFAVSCRSRAVMSSPMPISSK